ncbi:MAG: phage holin family protein [Gloeomargarita sp. SKYBB_i_bin120]|nr:phage holin family protein [Gloeomargarita sp. SKYG98]MCS7291785.1 phage holin family protein [Gloeomargarita sp. SKYB120]MDW8177345.1 phage holin family protein [Gloeomargarita sp. SKYBB_i_bin120]
MLTKLLVTWVVNALSLWILSRLPLGIRLQGFGTALWTALVLGLLNALVRPVLLLLTLPLNLLTLGLFTLVINALIFALAASLVKGFRLDSWVSALVGPILLTVLNGVLFRLLGA